MLFFVAAESISRLVKGTNRGVPKIMVPQNGWLRMENPIKMDDLGGTIIFGNIHIVD